MAVVGPNGAGKSTLFKGIVGMIKPLTGGIDLCGLRARDIAYLPQIAEIDRSFPISVYDMVAMGLWRAKGLFSGIGSIANTAETGGVAYMAHIGGFLAGLVLTFFFRGSRGAQAPV